ncbi:MAG: hypothetical protein ISS63_00670 [Desulfobacteraceae bacterium]|nr:hypothetical protein [Desulfobacteraceae bacterium]
MPNLKIDRVKLNQMLRANKPQREIAQVFGVTESAISKAKKELHITVIKNVAMESAGRVVDKSLNAVDQLQKINTEANQLLDELEQTPELKLKIMAEIRGQLKLQLEIFQSLYELKAVEEFQQEVLEVIGELNPDARDRIIRGLVKKRGIRTVIKY